MKDAEKIIMAIVALFAILVLAFSVNGMIAHSFTVDEQHTEANFNNAISSQLEDICATPPGYTDEGWLRHMGHHPDMYAECLE